MLEKLNEVKWNNFNHAYKGTAFIPDVLKALATNELIDTEHNPVDYLGYCIFHQGSLSNAALPTIPFLIELLAHEKTPNRTYLLSFIYAMAGAWTQVSAKACKSQKLWEYHSLERQVYNLISEYIDLYKMLLNSPDAQLKEMARRMIVRLNRVKPDYRENITEEINGRKESDNPREREA
jgi:hypothetical protein